MSRASANALRAMTAGLMLAMSRRTSWAPQRARSPSSRPPWETTSARCPAPVSVRARSTAPSSAAPISRVGTAIMTVNGRRADARAKEAGEAPAKSARSSINARAAVVMSATPPTPRKDRPNERFTGSRDAGAADRGHATMPISIPGGHDTAGSRLRATVHRNKNLQQCTLKNRNRVVRRRGEVALDDLWGGFSRGRRGRDIAADRGADAQGRRPRHHVARRLHVGHGRHQGGGAGSLGRRRRPRLPALRLLRPWRIRRPICRRHYYPLARGKPRRVRGLLRRAADIGGLVHGGMARASPGPRTAPGAAAGGLARRDGADRTGSGLHRGADVEAVSCGGQAGDRDRWGLEAPFAIFRPALSHHQRPDRGRSPASDARRADRDRLPGAHPAGRSGPRRTLGPCGRAGVAAGPG